MIFLSGKKPNPFFPITLPSNICTLFLINEFLMITFEPIEQLSPINDILEIIKENNIKGIVVGNPINMDGSKGPSSQSAKDFAKNLSNNISIPIVMWDERLSSQGAFNLSSNLDINTSKKVKKLDQNAASFILQGAIDYIIR